MRIVETHSHLNGLEYLQIRKPQLWDEIQSIIREVVYDDDMVDLAFRQLMAEHDWKEVGPTVRPQTDFVKERVGIEMRLGKHFLVAYDLFVKHLAFYIGDAIDVGIEILPMKSLQSQMSSGIGYYEGELYNVIRQGRGVPAVPLVLLGVDA